MNAPKRILRTLVRAIPSGYVIGRLAPGEGPAELIDRAALAQHVASANVGGGGGGGGGALPSGVRGDILYHNGTTWVVLAPSTSGRVLETRGAGANPAWTDLPAGSNGWVPLVTGEVTADGEPILVGDPFGQCIAVPL